MKPITPIEAKTLATSFIPDEVIQVVNDLLVENYSNNAIVLGKSQIHERLSSLYTQEEMEKGGYFNLSHAYSDWDVKVTDVFIKFIPKFDKD